MYSAARELISTVAQRDGRLLVRVADDRTGLSPAELPRRLAGGHIGMNSQPVRAEAGGGTMTVTPTGANSDNGSVA